MSMKKLVIASGLCMAVSGCIGFSWTSKVDDGAIYELNREMYIAEEDGLILVDARTEHPVYCTIKGTLPAGTKLQEPCMGKFSKAISKGVLSTLESIASAVPSTDIGICVRLIALSVISSALRLRNMIKNTF